MPRIDLDILNQKQTPAFYASSLATRPAAGFVGRIFIDSDSPSTGLYRDTGTAWVSIADPGAGTSGTLQQVTTNGNSTTTGITITTNGLGIGTTIPGSNRLDIHSASGINATFNGTGTTNSALQLQLAGVGKWNITNKYNSAANDFAITDILNSIDRLTITNAGVISLIGRLETTSFITANTNLTVTGTSNSQVFLTNTTTTTGRNWVISSDPNGSLYQSIYPNSVFTTLNTQGNFGINTINPSEFLEVNGAIKLTGSTKSYASASGCIVIDQPTTSISRFLSFGPNTSTKGSYAFYQTGANNTGGVNGLVIDSNSVATFIGQVNIGNTVAAGVAVASTHKVSILIGGVQYYLLASNV